MKRPVENEIKLSVESLSKALSVIRQHGFRVSASRVFEQNQVLDDEQCTLRDRGTLLRLRRTENAVTCTFKGAALPGRHKKREEREFTVSDLNECLAVFNGLGYRERFRYEKFRTEFEREGDRGHVTLDETPIGVYIELEGPAGWIDRTAKAFGFTRRDYITASYGQLYFEWCAKRGLKPSNLVFPGQKATSR